MAAKKAQMMPTFTYEGVDRKGAKIKGELPARNMALAKVTLRKQGITIKTIREKRKNILEGLMKKRVSTTDITIFTRQLATMMKAGVPLVQSFEIVAEAENGQDALEKPAFDPAAGEAVVEGDDAEAMRGHLALQAGRVGG